MKALDKYGNHDGKIVYLHSGGLPMTVIGSTYEKVFVCWMDHAGQLCQSYFPPECLTEENPEAMPEPALPDVPPPPEAFTPQVPPDAADDISY